MQDRQMRELSDQELESVVGGTGHHPMTFGSTSAGVSVTASASGGKFDIVIANTQSTSENSGDGPGISFAVGFAVGIAL